MALISVQDTALPAPDMYKYDVEPIGTFGRNSAGRLVGDKIGDKVKLSCSWSKLDGKLYAMIISLAREFFVNVTFTTPDGGTATKEMYVSPQSGSLKLIHGGFYLYEGVTCNFIER